MIDRRGLLSFGCAQCAVLAGGKAFAQAAEWLAPPRFQRPPLDTDEGGLWAFMDREEKRLRRSPFRMGDKALRDYLQGIACRLGADHCPDIRVYALRTPWFNASMAPNGMMQVWSGLMLRVDNEAQLASVIGHEIGHYLQRHAVERLRDAHSRSAFGMVLNIALGGVGALAQLALLAGQFGFTRDQEREADRIGVILMSKAGYDPHEAARVWANLRAEAMASGEDPAKRSVLFATHPDSGEREKTLAELASGRTGETGLEAWRTRIDPHLLMLLEDELHRGQFAETLVLLERLIGRDGENGRLLFARGEAYRLRAGEGDVGQAIANLEKAATLADAPAVVHRSLGLALQGEGAGERAVQAYRRYIELSPEGPDVEMIKTYIQGLQRS
ncbi:M48 family metallopeptidase [Cognatazoarcus halotolerans]|uniref:M48 family metallopeptidase n=1 Tax=Cognatazoarcus halotolerans TaxID=2686016 RepID=UPI001358C153|nr:M48 family metallopeptidase [Cognatazoarcus halotolerans]MCB1898547.1 M48 family metalloprotease [Rhodocyclaceae bacterium]MCP5310198.1 M48 family metalloprotease [Zoogloeaceae bacterium]